MFSDGLRTVDRVALTIQSKHIQLNKVNNPSRNSFQLSRTWGGIGGRFFGSGTTSVDRTAGERRAGAFGR